MTLASLKMSVLSTLFIYSMGGHKIQHWKYLFFIYLKIMLWSIIVSSGKFIPFWFLIFCVWFLPGSSYIFLLFPDFLKFHNNTPWSRSCVHCVSFSRSSQSGNNHIIKIYWVSWIFLPFCTSTTSFTQTLCLHLIL